MSNEADNLEERIAAYIDGQLSPAEAARLEVYLANTDAKLAEQVINMIGDRHRVQSLPKEAAPSDLAARIMEQVERTSLLHNVDQLTPPRRPWWQTRAAAAAVLFLVLGGFTYYMLQALRPANPAWQAAMDTGPAAHAPTIAALPAAEPASPAASSKMLGTLAAAPVRSLEKDGLDKTEKNLPASTELAAAPAANEPLILDGPAEKPKDLKKLAAGPVTLAFVARAPDDFSRLQQAMNAVQSPGAARRQSAAGGQAQFGMARAAETALPAANQESQNEALAKNQGQLQNQDQLQNRDQHQFQNQSRAEAAAPSSRNGAFQATNVQSNSNLANPQMAGAAPAPTPSADGSLSTPKASTNAVSGNFTPAVPVTYHVSLRPAEIASLIHEFRLAPPTSRLHEATTAPAPAGAEHFRALLPATEPTTAPATEPTADRPRAPDDRVDCIVTMAPPPATQPAP